MRYIESLNQSLHRLLQNDEKIIVLGEDILDPYGGAFKATKGLSTSFPDRVITTPISEASITGFSIGLAINGYKPILEIMFGDFILLAADQIINGASKFKWMYGKNFSLPIVIRTPMGGRRGYGPTHSQTLESFFLGVPNINIIAPSHCHDPGDLLYRTVLDGSTPTLFIENKSLYPMKLLTPDENSKLGEYFYEELNNPLFISPTISLILDKDNKPDVTIVTYGGMLPLVLEAVFNVFMQDEILVEILIPSSIKPIPLSDLLPSSTNSGKVLIVEEGIKSSGWGSEVASLLTENIFHELKMPIERIGASDTPIPSSRILEDHVLPQVDDIEFAINKLMK
jgi:pyruvate/2-oxoglutarate/acetoin dehydrogenase E1 component